MKKGFCSHYTADKSFSGRYHFYSGILDQEYGAIKGRTNQTPVGETAMQVADQLVEYANPYTPGSSLKKRGLIEGFGLDFFTPPTVASRYTTAEIQKRFLRTFQLNDLKGVSFEFGIATLGPLGNNIFLKKPLLVFSKSMRILLTTIL